MENVKKFYEALAKDEAMKKRAEALNEKHKGGKPDEAAVHADIIAFAKTEGYSFTPEDINAYMKQAKPLSDDELEAVAGGGGCGCAGAGGGGGKTPDGKTYACACVVGGGGCINEKSNDMNCICALGGIGVDDPML